VERSELELETVQERPNLPWLRPTKQDDVTYFVLVDRSHGELGRFTAHTLR